MNSFSLVIKGRDAPNVIRHEANKSWKIHSCASRTHCSRNRRSFYRTWLSQCIPQNVRSPFFHKNSTDWRGGRSKISRRTSNQRNGKIQRDRLGMQDSVWAMFDRDNHPQFKIAKQIAFRNKICVAVSNPCFEVWCILHYRDYDAPSSSDQCQRDLEQLCKNYDRRKGKLFADERNIKNGYCRAVERAMKLLERRNMEGHPDGNPSTSVHEITEHIRLFRKT